MIPLCVLSVLLHHLIWELFVSNSYRIHVEISFNNLLQPVLCFHFAFFPFVPSYFHHVTAFLFGEASSMPHVFPLSSVWRSDTRVMFA